MAAARTIAKRQCLRELSGVFGATLGAPFVAAAVLHFLLLQLFLVHLLVVHSCIFVAAAVFGTAFGGH